MAGKELTYRKQSSGQKYVLFNALLLNRFSLHVIQQWVCQILCFM